MASDKHERVEIGATNPTIAALERAVALARDTRAALELRLREAEANEGSADVTWLRRALLSADRRAKRLAGALGRESRRLSSATRAGGGPANRRVS
jgi:hypothetical protein